MVTVDILDNDCKLELLYTQTWCLNHSCRKLHASLNSSVTLAVNAWTHIYRLKKVICKEKMQLESICSNVILE